MTRVEVELKREEIIEAFLSCCRQWYENYKPYLKHPRCYAALTCIEDRLGITAYINFIPLDDYKALYKKIVEAIKTIPNTFKTKVREMYIEVYGLDPIPDHILKLW